MSLIERKVILVSKDDDGNTCMDFPVTKYDNIEDAPAVPDAATDEETAAGTNNTKYVTPAAAASVTKSKLDADGLWTGFHKLGENYVPQDTSNTGWNALGLCIIYYTKLKINNQPTQYGQLINIPATKDSFESMQLWVEQCSGRLYRRGGNGSTSVDAVKFIRLYDASDMWVE